MMEDDFPLLREASGASVIGQSVAWLNTAIAAAATDAVVTRQLAPVRSLAKLDASTAIRVGGITLAVAAAAAWGLSQLIPRYVATAIPGMMFLAVAALSAMAAMRAEAMADQYRASRLRRVMTWLSA